MKTIDFYSGFEGEGELDLVEKDERGEAICRFELWIGHFSRIMELVRPNAQGLLEGVAYQNSMLTGWHEEDSWLCPDAGHFLAQLRALDSSRLEPETKRAHAALVEFVAGCAQRGHRLYFEYD